MILAPALSLPLDDALLRLRSCVRGADRQAALRVVRETDWAKVSTRMAAVRPRYQQESVDGCLSDALDLVIIHPPPRRPICRRAVAVVVSHGYEPMLEVMLASLRRFGGAGAAETEIVVYALDDGAYQIYSERADMLTVRCSLRPGGRANSWLTGVSMTAPRQFPEIAAWLLLEADVIVRRDFTEIWQYVASNPEVVRGCAPQHVPHRIDLALHLDAHLPGGAALEFLTGQRFHGTLRYNGGVIAGGRNALAEVEAQVRKWWPFPRLLCEGMMSHWGDEAVKITAIEHLAIGEELPARWNRQYYTWPPDSAAASDDLGIQHFLMGGKPGFWATARELGLCSADSLSTENSPANQP